MLVKSTAERYLYPRADRRGFSFESSTRQLLSTDAKTPLHHHSDYIIPYVELPLLRCEVDIREGRDDVFNAIVAPMSRVAVDVVPRLTGAWVDVARRPEMNVVVNSAD